MGVSLPMILCLCGSVLALVMDSCVASGSIVRTSWGKIRGVSSNSQSGFSITAFEGIPYAEPPLGNLRFSKPVPSTGSNETIFNATTVRPSCLQNNDTRESEDCLYLDLYVPPSKGSPTNASALPVMVFIHGGSFIYHVITNDAERLLKKGVIVVFVKYRLGAMGFLSTGDDALKGNYGLWDQRMAINWVKDNVASFGGDPNAITLFGQSAGAASIAYQMLAVANSKDLFQRAILQSGAVPSYWSLTRNPAVHAKALGLRVGCVLKNSSQQFAKCLRNANGIHLQKEMFALLLSSPPVQKFSSSLFTPVIDHEFIVDEPTKLIKNASYLQSVGVLDKDIIIGMNNDEGNQITKNKELPNPPEFGDFFAKQLSYMLCERYGLSSPQIEKVVENFYRQDISKESLDKKQVSNAYADLLFLGPALEFIKALSKTTAGSGKRYLYYFDYCVPAFGVCMGHGFELVFEFIMDEAKFFTSEQEGIADKFTSLLTSFSRTGVPTANNTPGWTRFSRDSNTYMRISEKPEVRQNLLPKRVELWTKTIPSLISTIPTKHTSSSCLDDSRPNGTASSRKFGSRAIFFLLATSLLFGLPFLSPLDIHL